MTGNRLIACFCKGRGWTYNVGGATRLGPKSAQDLLVTVYGLRACEARERLQHARNGAVVALPERRERVNA
jgi:hypothetical protein